MKIPLAYSWRSLWKRRLTTALTLGGVALVVFVFASVLMLSHGVEQTMIDTGSPDDALVLRRSANSELVSQIDRDAANLIRTDPGIAAGGDGKPLISDEIVVIINLMRTGDGGMGNISVRGVSPEALALRPEVKITGGKMFRFGSHEIILGKSLAERYEHTGIGEQMKFGDALWTVVGHFEAGGTGFESEIWGDVEQFMPAFGRPVFSSLTFRLRDPGNFDAVKKRIEADPRTQYTELKREQDYYREQSKLMSDFIKILGLIVTIIFSIGAVIGAMITMYAAVANRTVEIGTMRALGFRRRSILGAFLVEAIVLSVIGGGAGIALASLMSFVRIATVNFGTFSELAFGFTLSPGIIVSSLIFSALMGLAGGFAPAVRASRLSILSALRSS